MPLTPPSETDVLRENLILVVKALEHVLATVDYTRHCCRPNAFVAAALPEHVIAQAHEALEKAALHGR